MADTQRSTRLRWRCRRGMKELDVLLERFLAQETDRLDRGDWPGFEALLEQEDDVLWDWVQAPHSPAAAEFRELLEHLRHAG